MTDEWVTLDGYVVTQVRLRAIAIVKSKTPAADWVWLPRSLCQDGDSLVIGDTDITVKEFKADQEGLEY